MTAMEIYVLFVMMFIFDVFPPTGQKCFYQHRFQFRNYLVTKMGNSVSPKPQKGCLFFCLISHHQLCCCLLILKKNCIGNNDPHSHGLLPCLIDGMIVLRRLDATLH